MVIHWRYQTDINIQVSRIITETAEIALNILQIATASVEGRAMVLNAKIVEEHSEADGMVYLRSSFFFFFLHFQLFCTKLFVILKNLIGFFFPSFGAFWDSLWGIFF